MTSSTTTAIASRLVKPIISNNMHEANLNVRKLYKQFQKEARKYWWDYRESFIICPNSMYIIYYVEFSRTTRHTIASISRSSEESIPKKCSLDGCSRHWQESGGGETTSYLIEVIMYTPYALIYFIYFQVLLLSGLPH